MIRFAEPPVLSIVLLAIGGALIVALVVVALASIMRRRARRSELAAWLARPKPTSRPTIGEKVGEADGQDLIVGLDGN